VTILSCVAWVEAAIQASRKGKPSEESLKIKTKQFKLSGQIMAQQFI